MSCGPLLEAVFLCHNPHEVESIQKTSNTRGRRFKAGAFCLLCMLGVAASGAGFLGLSLGTIGAGFKGISICFFPGAVIMGFGAWGFFKQFKYWANILSGFDTDSLIPELPLPETVQRLRDIKQEHLSRTPSSIIFWRPKINPLNEVAKVPLPEHWKKVLEKNSSLYRRLPTKLKPKLHQLINLFLCEIDFAPFEKEKPLIKITEEMRVNIAGDACLLILNMKSDIIDCFNHYGSMERVIISRGLLDKGYAIGLGGSHEVSLMWHYSTSGMNTCSDNGSVVVHEFAHTLDHTPDKDWGGIPLKEESPQYKPWKRWLEDLYDNEESIEILGRNILIREEDGAPNLTEFFAAATEVYFDQPKELYKSAPEVYRQLNSFYNLNTANWAKEKIVEIPPVIIDPSPDTVPGILHEEVALYRILPPGEKRKLIKLVNEFLREYTFEGRDGLLVTDPMKIAFAGQACILKLGVDYRIFTGFKRIILHPDQFMMNGAEYYTYDADDEIHFSWKSVSEAINQLRKTWQPLLLRLSNNLSKDQDWRTVKSRFKDCLNEYRSRCDNKTLYWWEWDGVKNVDHLFRTLTDDFFCRPYCMHQNLPNLYKAYKDFYCCDPLYWIEEKHRELAAKPFPDLWQKCLWRNVKHYSRLPSDLRTKLHGLIHIFLDEITFEKRGFRRITDKMRLCVAAEACILIVNRTFHDYRRIELVEIWKGEPEGKDDWGGDANQRRVRLNWHWTKDGMGDEDDNYNITMHEFAHVLDNVDDDIAQSVPEPKHSPNRKMWEDLLELEYPLLEEAYKSGRGHVIREYGLHTYGEEKRRAEFFTCATEAFFERSTRLQKDCPRIYRALRTFYQLDPANWDIPT